MNNITLIGKDYKQWISELSRRFRQSQVKAAVRVNSTMLEFYWSIGRDLSQKQFLNTYGSGFFKQVSADLQNELPDVKGLSPINIRYFKAFYELYSPLMQNLPQVAEDFNRQIVPQLAEELFSIPWDHHRRIIDRCKDNPPKAIFFVRKTKENNWSRAVLLNFLDTDLFEREGKAITNFKTSLPAPDCDLAQQMTKDPYCFDFLSLSKKYTEKELKDALMDNIQRFLLELGNGFEAQYALESSSQPIGVSAYQLSKLLPESFKSSLPAIEELESALGDFE